MSIPVSGLYFLSSGGLPDASRGKFWADWTGFGENTKSLTTSQHGKTLWDWMEFLITPAVLVLSAWWFSKAKYANDSKLAEKRVEIGWTVNCLLSSA